MTSRLDLTGRTFGRWRVLEAIPSAGGHAKTKWRCQCACGTIAEVRTSRLLAGDSQSCGCRARDVGRQRRPWQRRNLKGQRFGKLLVLRASPTNLPPTNRSLPGGATAWFVQCDCGRVVVIATRDLTRPKNPVQDCGCSRLRPAAVVSSAISSTGRRDEPAADVPLKTTSSAEALRQFKRAHSAIGEVRRIFRSVQDADQQMHVSDFDPFDPFD